MAVALKLYRKGKKNFPSYRIVAVEKHYKADGKYIEEVGFYDPIANPVVLNIKKERFDYWVKVGAQISEGLHKLLKNRKLVKLDS
jgi:small subunit ribosomal protein S16